MDKDKPIDRNENNIENIKEDYKDSNGNPKDFIEDLTDPETTAIFKEAFYAEGKALEEEALRSPFVEDEEKKEALRLRILAAAGRSTEGALAADRGVADDAVKVSVEAVKNKKKGKFTPFMRWAAVLALVCLGVFGVSVTGQAKGSGLWSSIQRLIGGETRWENENNGADRNISDPEEYKAIGEIEEKLVITIPKFFYWPDNMDYKEMCIFEESNSFMIIFTGGKQTIYFEGWKGENTTSLNSAWMSEKNEKYIEHDGICYTISESDDEENGKRYYVRWTTEDNKFVLSGINDLEEIEKILKNVKN